MGKKSADFALALGALILTRGANLGDQFVLSFTTPLTENCGNRVLNKFTGVIPALLPTCSIDSKQQMYRPV